MANPYSYYPEQGMLKPMLDVADTATRLYGIREHSRLSENELAQRGRIADEEMGIRREANAINRQNANTHAQQLVNQTPLHKREFKPTVLIQSKLAALHMYGEEGVKAFMPIYDAIKEVGMVPGSTYEDVHSAAMSLYPEKREEVMSTIEKMLLSDKLTPEKKKQLGAVYDAVAYDTTGERIIGMGIMKNTAASIRQEQENSKAAIQDMKNQAWAQNIETKLTAQREINDAKISAAEARAASSGKNQLTINDIKTAYGMEMTGIKNRMLADMTPEEQTNFANMAPEQLMAALMAGGGKNLPPEKKKQYIGEMQAVENYYGGLTQQALGRKGAQLKPTASPEQPKGPEVNQNEPEAVKYLKDAKTRAEAVERIRNLAASVGPNGERWSKSQLDAIAAKAGWE